MRERIEFVPPFESFFDDIQGLLNQIECPNGCQTKKFVVNLKEAGTELFVYCNQCGGIVYDSKPREDILHK